MISSREEKIFHGNPVSVGAALGQALKLDSRNRLLLKLFIEPSELEGEIARFKRAIRASQEQLEVLKSRLTVLLGSDHGFIFDAHLLMLEDQSFVSEINDTIRSKHANAEWALIQTSDKIRAAYAALEEEYFRDRGVDIESLVERILFNLSGDKPISWAEVPQNVILVARDIGPTAFGAMDLEKVKGVVLESGARTSHTAIIARSLRIPAIMGVRDFLGSINSGDPIFLDGDNGLLIIHPSAERLAGIGGRIAGSSISRAGPERPSDIPSGIPVLTTDGTPIFLRANIELPHEVKTARQYGALGIGLFRTEFLFFAHPHGFPGIEAQHEVYRELAREMQPHFVSIRTLDCSPEFTGDMGLGHGRLNTGIGMRGIRQSLQDHEVFADQIEAILRTRLSGCVDIVLPMITSAEEVIMAKEVIREVVMRMDAAPAMDAIRLGGMIEVPSAVFCLEAIAAELDFICVGTNDLIQYLLAVDRLNPDITHLYQPLHPAVVHALSHIAKVCVRLGKPARICGEICANPILISLLIGMGYRDFSMNAFAIPTASSVVQRIQLPWAEQVATQALQLQSAKQTGDYLIAAAREMIHLELTPFVQEILGQPSWPRRLDPSPDATGSISLNHQVS